MRLIVLFLLLLSASSALAEPAADGRASIRTIYSTDDGPLDKEIVFNILDFDLRATDLTPLNTGLVIDSTFIYDATRSNERRFGETESIPRVRQAYIAHKRVFGVLDVNVGRRVITEAGNAWMDGVEMVATLPGPTRVGVYGGLRPDPAFYSLSTDYQALGSYATYRRDGLNADLGYNTVFADQLDRQFLYSRVHYRPARRLYFSTYLVADLLDDPELSTFLGTVDYTPVKAINLGITFSRYSIERYRNEKIYRNIIEPNQALILGDEVINLVYNRVRFNLSYRFLRRYYHYQSVEYKIRSQDDLEAWVYTIGIRDSDAFASSVRLDLRAIFKNNYQSDSWLIALDADRDLANGMSLNLRATVFDGRTIDRFTERGRTFDEAQKIYLVGGGLNWRPAKQHHLSLHYDGIYETDLQDRRNEEALVIHMVMARYGWYF